MPDELIEISRSLTASLAPLTFEAPVTHVFNPLTYAAPLHEGYLRAFGARTPRPILLVGMNPGPWGMGQTGVPFGDVDFVRDWMGIDGAVFPPPDAHPKRPITGLACPRNEVSGSRLWGWARDRFGVARAFFEHVFVHNYCPLLFLEDSGRNRTPNKLKKAERDALFPPCDRALRALVAHFEPTWVIGVGAFAERRVKAAMRELDRPPSVGRILHPSPASPKANRGWAAQADAELLALGVDLPDRREG